MFDVISWIAGFLIGSALINLAQYIINRNVVKKRLKKIENFQTVAMNIRYKLMTENVKVFFRQPVHIFESSWTCSWCATKRYRETRFLL